MVLTFSGLLDINLIFPNIVQVGFCSFWIKSKFTLILGRLSQAEFVDLKCNFLRNFNHLYKFQVNFDRILLSSGWLNN